MQCVKVVERSSLFKDFHVYSEALLGKDDDYCVEFVLTSLKVFGELPTLSVGLTDDCVTEILQVLASIPLPESYSATTDEDADDFAESVST